MAWACVTNSKGEDLVETHDDLMQDMSLEAVTLPVGKRTVAKADFDLQNVMKNNSGELIALVMGLRIATRHGSVCRKVYSDSDLMVKWWSTGHVNADTRAKMEANKEATKLAYIAECAELRRIFEKAGGSVLWVSGKINPADLGMHK